MLPPKVGGRGREHRLDYPRGDDNKGYDRVWRSNEKDFINNYEPPGEGFKDWLLFMCINTKDSLGKFSLSLYGESARELKVDPQQILGKEVPMLKDCFFTSRINPLDIRMIPYRWYTEWFNLLDEILSGNMALFNREGAATLNEDVVKLVFSNPDYAICIRYEITFEDNNQAVLKARALNMPLQQIAGTSFERGNVATVAIQSFPLMTLGMDPPINQLGFEFPIYPVLLAPHELTMNSYESYCLEALPAILQTVHDHLDLTPQQMAKQIKTKSALKNEYRFKNMVNHKKRARDNDEFLDPLKGGHTVLKWGTKFDLRTFIPVPTFYVDALETSLSLSTWSTYATAFRMLKLYAKLLGKEITLPVSRQDLIGFVVFLFRGRRIAPSTIRQYISGIKCFHNMLDCSLEAFQSTALKYVLMGFENQYKAWEEDGPRRRAFTFPLLKLMAKAISECDIIQMDAQCLWTAALIAFWTSCRMGDLLVDSHNSNQAKLLTWDNIQSKDAEHMILYFAHPKQAKRENGLVCDIFSFPEKLYCPVDNLRRLAKMNHNIGRRDRNNHVFNLSKGGTLRMSKMNEFLREQLLPMVGSELGTISCHSFRAALPSLMAASPDMFTTEETLLQGDWHSDSYKLYTRLNNIGRKQTHRKVVATILGSMSS